MYVFTILYYIIESFVEKRLRNERSKSLTRHFYRLDIERRRYARRRALGSRTAYIVCKIYDRTSPVSGPGWPMKNIGKTDVRLKKIIYTMYIQCIYIHIYISRHDGLGSVETKLECGDYEYRGLRSPSI